MNNANAIETAPVHVFQAAGLGQAPFTLVGFQKLVFQACPGEPIRAGGSCDFCGTCIMNAFQIESSDGKRFKVGSDCVAKTGDAGLIRKVRRMINTAAKAKRAEKREAAHKAARLTREQAAKARRAVVRAEALAFAKAHNLISAFKVACRGKQAATARDILGKLRAFGSLTPATVAFVKSMAKSAVAPAAPVGKVTFKGTIVSAKTHANDFGVQYKMTVESEEGWRAWMTIPSKLMQQLPSSIDGGFNHLKGIKIEVTVTLQASKDDPAFAFGSRPKATLVAA